VTVSLFHDGSEVEGNGVDEVEEEVTAVVVRGWCYLRLVFLYPLWLVLYQVVR